MQCSHQQSPTLRPPPLSIPRRHQRVLHPQHPNFPQRVFHFKRLSRGGEHGLVPCRSSEPLFAPRFRQPREFQLVRQTPRPGPHPAHPQPTVLHLGCFRWGKGYPVVIRRGCVFVWAFGRNMDRVWTGRERRTCSVGSVRSMHTRRRISGDTFLRCRPCGKSRRRAARKRSSSVRQRNQNALFDPLTHQNPHRGFDFHGIARVGWRPPAVCRVTPGGVLGIHV